MKCRFLFLIFCLLTSVAANPIMPPERETALRKLMPKVGEAWLQKILDSDDLLIYTEREIPKAFQLSGGVHNVYHNLAAIQTHETGNGNVFPWRDTAGTHAAKNVTTFKFLSLPKDADGKVLPVIWWYERLSDADTREGIFEGENGYRWIFPQGTTVGEVLLITGPNGYRYPFELRIRNRKRKSWAIEVYRPFRTPTELRDRIVALRPNWQDSPDLKAAVENLNRRSVHLSKRLIKDKAHRTTSAFKAMGGIDSLPDLGDDALVVKLLKTTVFEPSSGGHWRTDGETECFAPTTKAAFHVIPAGYTADVVRMESADCMKCHQNTNQQVRKFDMRSEWYGTCMGSDGIISFHPFSPSSITSDGSSIRPRMNAKLEKAGIIAQFDWRKHREDRYTTRQEE